VRLSSERISHISHLIFNKLWADDLIDFESEEKAVREIKRTISEYLDVEEEVDGMVRKKIASYSRKIPEGSSEWGVLYRKFFEEEMAKRKRL